tara:strand:- start:218 stop:535 length:318 start_codon:yes stop_codon:yes gene_type:complete
MAVTWNVVSLNATKTVGSLSDVVTTVHWTASDADGNHTGSSYGSVGLAEPDSGSFTAYADITEDNAIAWAKAALGADEVTSIEAGIAAQITESKTPTKSTGVPWS